MKTKTKNPIERIGRNAVKIGKMIISLKDFKDAEKYVNNILNENLDYLKI